MARSEVLDVQYRSVPVNTPFTAPPESGATTTPRVAAPMAGASGPHDPTLTVPKSVLGAVSQLPPASVPTHEALRERLQRAAQLARQNKATEALGEFEAVYTNYLTLGDPALAIIGAKAAFNRGVLLEKLLGDTSRAELAFEKLFANFAQFEAAEIRAVVARSGLHAARLAAANLHLQVAVQRYSDRLGPYGEYLPPLELRGFIADYRRLRAESRAQAQGIVPPSGLPEIVDEREVYSLAPPVRATTAPTPGAPAAPLVPTEVPVDVAAPTRAQASNVVEFPAHDAVRAADATKAPAATGQRTPVVRENPPVAPTAAAPAAVEPTHTAARAAAPVVGMTREEFHSMLEAMDRRMAAYVADVRGEVGALGSALAGLNAAVSNVQSQHLQLRNELQTQEGQQAQNLNARFHDVRDDLRDGLADVRTELRALATEQRHARTTIVAVVLMAAALIVAVTLAF